MFDEPIRTGLVQFADVYDHLSDLERLARSRTEQTGRWVTNELLERSLVEEREARNRWRAAVSFDQSHQPLLFVYTTTGRLRVRP